MSGYTWPQDCRPFRVERSKLRLPRFPSRKVCLALGDSEHPDCCCRSYPGRGAYVVGACGHAHGWDLDLKDARAQAARLNETVQTGGRGPECPMTPPSRAPGGSADPAEDHMSREGADRPARALFEESAP